MKLERLGVHFRDKIEFSAEKLGLIKKEYETVLERESVETEECVRIDRKSVV